MEQLTKINQHIHRLLIPYKDIYTTVLFIRTDEGVVLFDTATYETDISDYILPALKELEIAKEEVRYIFISHNHGDHAGGLNWLIPALPHGVILTNSPALMEKYGDTYSVRTLDDGEIIAGSLRYYAIPGHAMDASGLLDLRTKTLMTGDALQVYGIYGSGKWGANIRRPELHFPALEKLHTADAELLIMAHDYHPCGPILEGKEAIDRCINDCAEALNKIRDYILENPDTDDEALAERYNATFGLPTVSEKVFAGMRELIKM